MTGNEILAQVKGYFPDGYDQANYFLPHLQATHNEILTLVRVKPDEEVDIDLVDGTYNYELDPTVVRIWAACYLTSAQNQNFFLMAKSMDEWDAVNPYWRTLTPAQPTYYDERAGEVLFQPTPPETTDVITGYPLIRLYVQTSDTLSLTSEIPNTVQNYDAWIAGVCWRYSIVRHREQADFFRKWYTDSMRRLVGYSQGKAERVKPTLKPRVPIPRVV